MIINGETLAAKEHLLRCWLERGDWYIALYTVAADRNATTGVYSRKDEVTGPGYKAGGKALTNGRVVMDGTVACLTFDDVKWPLCSIEAGGAAIYDKNTGIVLTHLDFGGNKISSNGPFTVFMPLASGDSALFRL